MRLLIVEDEHDLARALQRALEEEGYACDVAADGPRGLQAAETGAYDLVVLDLMLPGLDGRGVLRKLRETHATPVLILTARDAPADKVALLDTGADDYLTKPFDLDELVARVRALIRRAAGKATAELTVGDVVVDTAAHRVRQGGESVALTPKEYSLVEYLVTHQGTLITRTQIYDHIYDETEDTLSNVVDVYISNIRRKLGKGFVTTRRGEGYIVEATGGGANGA
jgi:two-component system, OmpR family, response regulator